MEKKAKNNCCFRKHKKKDIIKVYPHIDTDKLIDVVIMDVQ
jgi:hypothetical protein